MAVKWKRGEDGYTEPVEILHSELSRRDVFALVAMHAIIGKIRNDVSDDHVRSEFASLPSACASVADAVLRELDKPSKE